MKVLVYGNGLMGRATVEALRGAGHEVWAWDVVPDRCELGLLSKQDRMDYADALVCCVATEPTEDGRLELGQVREFLLDAAMSYARRPRELLVVERATLLPGTARELELELKKLGAPPSMPLHFAYVPLFGYRATADANEAHPYKVVVGLTERVVDQTETEIRALSKVTGPVMTKVSELFCHVPREKFWWGTYEEAEFAKLWSNHTQVVVLGLWNEMAAAGRHLGVDSRWVMETICQEPPMASMYRVHGKAFEPTGRMGKDAGATVRWAEREAGGLPVLAGALRANEQTKGASGVQTKPTMQLMEEDARLRSRLSRAR